MSSATNANGIRKAKLWQIGGFAFNNTATNLYMFLMMFISYFMVGFLGVATVLASSLIMGMRIWDGVTDPFMGWVVDRTNTKFGKNRPFMVLGNLILAFSSFIMIFVTPSIPKGFQLIFFVGIYAVYIIGYTFQCIVTKSAQTCLTNDPKQRPLFSIFDGVYNTALFTGMAIYVSSYLAVKYKGFSSDVGLFREFWAFTAIVSAVLTCIAIFAISKKDTIENFGTGKVEKVGFRDYWDVIRHNRAIQMLVVAAGTDKLATQIRSNSTVTIMLYGIICGNFALSGAVSGYTSIPSLIFLFFGAGVIATRLGQKRAMVIGSWGALIFTVLSVLLWVFGDPTTLAFPGIEGFNGWTFFTVAFLICTIASTGFMNISGNIVIPMTADCADYEVYRSGRYVPGMMGTLFSFVDKLISSLATTIVGMLVASIGFTNALPDVNTPYNTSIFAIAMFCMYGMIGFGLLCNVVAMKFYPLTKEKMEHIQMEIARIKEQAQAAEQNQAA